MYLAARSAFLATVLLLPLAACVRDATGVADASRRPPYLAIVVGVDAPAEVTSRGPYAFRVREISGTLGVDTTVHASPKDTIILSVQPSTYRVDIADVPATCGVRDGTTQMVTVPPNTNTSLARFKVECAPALAISVLTSGFAPDTAYVLTVKSDSVPDTGKILASNDTVRIDGLAAGTYDVSLRQVAANCVVTSDGGESVQATITASGGAAVAFRVVCSEEARRPKIVSVNGSHDGGSVALYLRAADPDRDVERIFVDVTDCRRRSVLPGGIRRRGGFSGFPTVTGRDTAQVVAAFDLGVSDSTLVGRCLVTAVADERGNTSEYVEQPLPARSPLGSPVASGFNARYNGTSGLQVQLTPNDPDADFVGLSVYYLLRDGVVAFPADGQFDRLLSHPAGIVGSTIPELPFGIGFGQWNDYLGAIVFEVDRAGNFTRLEDMDLFR